MNRDPIEPAPDPEYDAKMAELRKEADELLERRRKHDADPLYPRQSGDFTAIGPECFTDADADVICYKGENYVRKPDPEQPARETLDLELNLTTTDGIQIPGKFIIEYPPGNGFYFVKALQQITPDHLNPLWNELIQRQDAATVRVMLESGHNRGGDDD